jgi:hypothetical protein
MLHKSYQTGILPNLSNAALLGILWVTRVFTPLESPAIHGGNDINKTSIPHRKGGVKAPSFLTGFTKNGLCNMLGIPVFNVGRWPPCLRRSGYAQAGGKLFQHSCLLDYVIFFCTIRMDNPERLLEWRSERD